MIDLTGVTMRYPTAETPAVEDVSLTVEDGEFVFLVGASGSGKSTLLRLLLGERVPTAGRIVVAGHDLGRMPARKRPAYRREVGVVFQDFRLLPDRSVADNVAFALQVTGCTRTDLATKVPAVLERVGLAHKAAQLPAELSGGEQQRVALARALVNEPALLLADEPTGNLDPATGADVLDLIAAVNAAGTTVVMATHDVVAVDRLRRRVVEVAGGRIVRDEGDAAYTRPIRVARTVTTTAVGKPSAAAMALLRGRRRDTSKATVTAGPAATVTATATEPVEDTTPTQRIEPATDAPTPAREQHDVHDTPAQLSAATTQESAR